MADFHVSRRSYDGPQIRIVLYRSEGTSPEWIAVTFLAPDLEGLAFDDRELLARERAKKVLRAAYEAL